MKTHVALEKFYQYAFPMLTVLVTCKDTQNKTNIITISWQTTLSKDPPLYGIALHPKRHSYTLIQETKEFVVNFLSSDYVKDVHFCGTHSGKNIDKIKHTNLSYIAAEKVSPPLIKEAYAHIECTLADSYAVGDHILLIGRVVSASADPMAFTHDLLNMRAVQPIYYRGGNSYVALDKDSLTEY
jgi:flavin reductase (DIM6/NTAB) family NADH-FMN oxidoreductase RutF